MRNPLRAGDWACRHAPDPDQYGPCLCSCLRRKDEITCAVKDKTCCGRKIQRQLAADLQVVYTRKLCDQVSSFCPEMQKGIGTGNFRQQYTAIQGDVPFATLQSQGNRPQADGDITGR